MVVTGPDRASREVAILDPDRLVLHLALHCRELYFRVAIRISTSNNMHHLSHGPLHIFRHRIIVRLSCSLLQDEYPARGDQHVLYCLPPLQLSHPTASTTAPPLALGTSCGSHQRSVCPAIDPWRKRITSLMYNVVHGELMENNLVSGTE